MHPHTHTHIHFCLLVLIKSTLKGQADKAAHPGNNWKNGPNLSVSLKQIWRSLCCVLVMPEEIQTWKVPALVHGWHPQPSLVLDL